MMRPLTSLLTRVLFLRCFLFISAHTVFAQSTGTIRGTVTDNSNGQPLPLVNVLIQGTTVGAATDDAGTYEIKGLQPGTYVMVFRLVGYQTLEVPGIIVERGSVVTKDAVLAEEAVQQGEVVVYGASLRSEKITDAPAAVTVLNARDISLGSVSGQLPKLLEMQTGVEIAQNGLNDFNVNTRGFNSSLNRRLLVLLDGRDLAIAFLGSQEWNGLSVPIEDLGKLELIRGPGSALYGANAFNGVVNILTPKPKDITGLKLTTAGGEKNTLRMDARYAGVSERWSYKMNIGFFQGDSWSVSRLTYPFEYDGFNPFLNTEVVPVDPAKVASTYGSGRLDYEFKPGEVVTFEGGTAQVENEIFVTGIGRVQVPKAVKPWGRMSYSQDNFYAQVWVANRKSLKPQISLSTGLPLEEQSTIAQFDGQYRFSAMDDKLFVVVGGSYKNQLVDTKGTLTAVSHNDHLGGVYTQLEYRFSDEFKSIAAVRGDYSTLHATQFSPKVAVVWSPVTDHSFRFTYNKAFQAPNYSELFLYVRHPTRNLVYLGNDQLIVEKITGYEMGYKGTVGKSLFVTVDGYYNQLSDFITDLAPGVNPNYPGQIVLPGESVTRTVWSYGNAGHVNEMGVEFGAGFYISDYVRLLGNYAYFDFEVKEQNANDVLLPNSPKHKLNGGISYTQGRLGADVSVKYVPTFDWAAGIYKGKVLAYAVVNLGATYQLSEILSVGLNVTNLLDRSHYELFGGSLIGRRAILGVTATL